jgi:ATP-binding cassette subfamily F protein 3
MADAAVGPFSGGEKSRLTLALIVWQRPNLLLLDEPTNHLDLEMRQALTMALQDFEGAMVLVSHDRHLLRASTDTLLLVVDGGCAPFDGDLDDHGLAAGAPAAGGGARRGPARPPAAAPGRGAGARSPVRQRSPERQLADVEQDLAALGVERQRLESLLRSQSVRQTAGAAEGLPAGRLRARLQQAEERWLELQAQLEALEPR